MTGIRVAALYTAAGRTPRTVDPWHVTDRDGADVDPDELLDAMLERSLGIEQ